MHRTCTLFQFYESMKTFHSITARALKMKVDHNNASQKLDTQSSKAEPSEASPLFLGFFWVFLLLLLQNHVAQRKDFIHFLLLKILTSNMIQRFTKKMKYVI